MAQEDFSQSQGSDYFSDLGIRLRDLEEKQRLVKDRVLIIGESLVNEKNKTLVEIQELKKAFIQIKDENARIISILKNVTEQLSTLAKRTDLEILQRQFDLFRKA